MDSRGGFEPGRSVEQRAARGRFHRTFLNPDGTTTAQITPQPRHYLTSTGWEDIDPALTETSPGTWRTTANEWTATFDATGVSITLPDGEISWAPLGAATVAPQVSEDRLSVTYPGLWPGVDLRYRVSAAAVKEELVLEGPNVRPGYAFGFDSTTLAEPRRGDLTVTGPLADDVDIGAIRLVDATGRQYPENQRVRRSLTTEPSEATERTDRLARGVAVPDSGAAEGRGLVIAVDRSWLRTLPASAFPMTTDPTISLTTNNAYSYANDGWAWACPHPGCLRAGNSLEAGNRYWRGIVSFDYQSLMPAPGKASALLNAQVMIWYGSDNPNPWSYAIRHASNFSWCGVSNSPTPPCTDYRPVLGIGQLSTGSLTYDVTGLVGQYWNAGQMVAFAISGDEVPGTHTHKLLGTVMYLTYNTLPTIPQSTAHPSSGYTFHNHLDGISLAVPPVTDPDGGTVYYRFVLCPQPTWSTCAPSLADSGFSTSSSFALHPGTGLHASWYNEPRYWGIQIANNPAAIDGVWASPWFNTWTLQNQRAPNPTVTPTAFTWDPAEPQTVTITPDPAGDPEGDLVAYRYIVTAPGDPTPLYTSPWSGPTTSPAPLGLTIPTDSPLVPDVVYEVSPQLRDHVTAYHDYYYGDGPQP